jgi:hypothetical protein
VRVSSYLLIVVSVTWSRKSRGRWPFCSRSWHSRPDRL